MSQSFSNIKTFYYKHQGMIFPFSFIAVYSVFHLMYFYVPDETLKQIYYDYLVTISADLINFFAPEERVFARNNSLLSARANLEVVRGCDGAGVMFLMTAAILVFSASLKRKLIGLLAGLALVYVLNQIRIISLYFIVVYQRDWFLPVHTYVAPSFIILFCSLFFMWWAFQAPLPQQHATE